MYIFAQRSRFLEWLVAFCKDLRRTMCVWDSTVYVIQLSLASNGDVIKGLTTQFDASEQSD